jgi:predicted dehydrogenase
MSERKLGVLIVGCGRIATLNVLGYRDNPHARVWAVCDLDRGRACALAAETGATKIYTDYDEALRDPEVDIVELLVPHHLHCEMTVRACLAGKHVSVQKPMALSLEECDRMIEAAQRAGVLLKVYENFVFYPPYVLAKRLIDEGEIGEPLSIRLKMNAGCGKYGWRVDPATWAWRMQEEMSGGGELVFDDGNHKFSLARYLMGEPETVFAFIGHTLMEGESYLDRQTGKLVPFYQDAPSVIVWKYRDSQKFGVFDITYSKDLEIRSDYYACDERVEVTGTKGVLWVTRCTGKMLDIPTLIVYRDCETRTYGNLRDDWADSFIDSTRDFIDAVRLNRPPRLTGEEGKAVLKFSLAAMRSAREMRPVRIDEME